MYCKFCKINYIIDYSYHCNNKSLDLNESFMMSRVWYKASVPRQRKAQ